MSHAEGYPETGRNRPAAARVVGSGMYDGPRMTGYVHIQTEPSAAWLVQHGLGKKIMPTLTLSGFPDEPVFTDIEFVDEDTLIVIWSQPETGRAEF